MKKKTAAILLGTVISVAFLSACGNNEATEAASQGEKTEVEEDSGEQETEEKETETTETEDDATAEIEEDAEEKQEDLKTVAVLLPDEEWAEDGDNLKTELEAVGYEAKVMYADNSGEKQSGQVLEMAEEQTDAFIIAPADPYALTDALETAKENSIPVFSYDELIMDSEAVSYYVTFNTREIGQALANALIENKDLEKAQQENKSYNIEFLMGSTDDIKSLYLYNGIMEVLQPYLDDGTLVCQSGKTSFEDTGILRFSESEAERRIKDILAENYQGKTLDIICTSFDKAAEGAASALESVGIIPGSGQWALITGVGCELQAVQGIAEGSQFCSVFMDRQVLAKKCVEMVDTYLEGDDPEVTDYELYDNGKKIIGTYTCEIQLIDKDNFELLIDKGYYGQEEIMPEAPEGKTLLPGDETTEETTERTVGKTETENENEEEAKEDIEEDIKEDIKEDTKKEESEEKNILEESGLEEE